MNSHGPLRACIFLWPAIYRLWPSLMFSLAVFGSVACWLIWPISKGWALTALILPHLLPISVAIHEAGHVLAALAFGYPAHSLVIIAERWDICVEIPGGARQRWIAAAGPACAVGIGAGLTVAGWCVSAQLFALAIPFLAHMFGLLPGIGDGQTLWTRQSLPRRLSKAPS